MKIENAVTVFKTLGDNSRLGIIRNLLKTKMCVEDIAANLALAESTVSFHLNKLESAGLVNREKDQYYTYYRLKPGILNHSLISLIDDSGTDTEKTGSEEHKKRIFDTFFRDGRLVNMPRQNKKRRLILEFFADKFEYGREYPEKDINSTIKRFYDDYCLVRRELVGYGLFSRKGKNPVYIKNGEKNDMKTQLSKDEKKRKSAEWKDRKTAGGIYCIKNRKTGKILLGSSVNINGAINRAKAELGFNSHRSKSLQQDWNTEGPENFEFSVLEELENEEKPGFDFQEELEKLEKKWISRYQPFDEKCYNTQKDIRRFAF